MMRKVAFVAAAVVAASTALAGLADRASAFGIWGRTVVDATAASGQYTTFGKAIEAAGLVGTLSGDGPFTVFAPTDEAFAALPAGTVENLLRPENKAKLTEILTYHVVPGNLPPGDLLSSAGFHQTVQGGTILPMGTPAQTIFVNESNVNTPDSAFLARVVETLNFNDNGVVYGIDRVLMPAE